MARVGIDLDGVCYDFAASLKHFLVEHEGMDPARCTPPHRWEFYLDWGMSVGQFLSACGRGVNEGVVFMCGGPIEDAAQHLARLKDAGHEVHIITDRAFGTNNRAQSNTYAWLAAHGIPYDSVTFTSDKTSVPVDYMIDDKVENYDALVGAGVDVRLIDRPWNEHAEHASRVETLAEFVDHVLYCENAAPGGLGYPVRIEHDPTETVIPLKALTGGEVRTVSSTGGEKGVKLARFDLIPAGPLRQVAEHYGKGAEKYEARNWERGYEWSKSFGALMRHAWQWQAGEDIDVETQSHHMAAVVFHALALIEFAGTHPEFDDRPGTS